MIDRHLTIALAALAALVLAPLAAAQEKLEIVSPHPQVIEDEFGPAFEAYYKAKTGREVSVKWRDMGGTSDDLRWIKSEFAKRPEGVDVDLFFGGGSDPYVQLKALGVLQPYRTSDQILSRIPSDIGGVPLYDAEEFTWYGTAISGFGVIYNKALLKRLGAAEPRTWEDLANPKLFTWVGAGDPRHSGTVHMTYEIILEAYGWRRGWEIIAAMGGNTKTFFQAASDIPRAVASGQVAAGGAIDFYAWTQIEQAGSDKIGFAMPIGLTVINTDSIGILRGAPNPEAAKAFVDFVLSDGQKLWYLKSGAPGGPKKSSLYRMPVDKTLYAEFAGQSAVTTNPFAWGKGLEYNAALATARYEAINDLIGAVIIDSHDELVPAWKSASKAADPAKALAELAAPPVTEDELTQLAKTDMTDPIKRNNRITQWVNAAREKYRALAR